ncbi:TonB-dependent receptor [Asticcacaulis tiandongensis]|uniref:TonB-dependent receptor n=1 Tax=Asticcacaulis tiandongensis TaxID=2565365 RepID=UPI001FEC6152|nr:TonB-dependent receptor [Asticcacaulis tiandongensis]
MRDSKRTRGTPRPYGRNVSAAAMLCGVSAVALSAFAAPAFAQNTAPAAEEVEEVVVTGIRRSLQNAQNIKRTSDVIVDSVTAEDIGALPDRSVTEALQRIPGVSINRFAAGVDPDHFSVEGSGVTVRGLNLTRSELNGRDSFSANNGRALSFADVPSELMAGVDVFKNPSADMIEGGIAGTVNLRTRVPFGSSGQVFSFSAEGSYGDFAKKWTPTYSALYSNRWDTEVGEFGLLVNYVNSELTTRSDGAQLSNYSCRDDILTYDANNPTAPATPVTAPGVSCNGNAGVYFPRGAVMRTQTSERKREGYGVAAQWRSTDDTMLATFQFLRSEATQAWTEHTIEIATDNVTSNGDSFPVYGTDVEYDQSGVFTNGLISGYTGWRSDVAGGNDSRTPRYGLQSNNQRRDQNQEYMTQDMSLALQWTPNERWGFKFDLQHVKSDVVVDDHGLWSSSFQDVEIRTNGKDIPDIRFRTPTLLSPNGTPCDPANGDWDNDNGCGLYAGPDHPTYADPYNTFWRAAMDHFERSEGELLSFRADSEYIFEPNNYITSISFGARWAERDQTTRFSSYNWGAVSEIWGGTGPVWLDETLNNGQAASSNGYLFGFDNFMNGEISHPLDTPRWYSSIDAVADYQTYRDFASAISSTWRDPQHPDFVCGDGTPAPQNWVPADLRCDVVDGPFRANEINPINEINKAAYVMVKYRHEADNGWTYSGNVGLRYTSTNRQSDGYIAFPFASMMTEAQCAAARAESVFCNDLSPAVRDQVRAFSNGAIIPVSAKTDMRYLLPSFNLKVQPSPEWVFRLGLSKTLTYPEMGVIRNYQNYAMDLQDNARETVQANGGVPRVVAGIGNPNLTATTSNNIDLSAEWYFAPVGSLTLALFHKELYNVVTNDTRTVPLTNNGVTFEGVISQPMNSPDKAKIKGFELAYQQTFNFLPSPFDGLGVNANYSYISSSNVSQSTLSATDPDVAAGRVSIIDTSLLPLQGLSKRNANLAVFYEKYGLSARLAYNYRSDFLITVRDVIVPYQPIMQEGGGQIDASLFYDITPQIKIGVQGVNLNNEITHTRAILNNQLLTAGRSWFVNDRRVTFVIRGTF